MRRWALRTSSSSAKRYLILRCISPSAEEKRGTTDDGEKVREQIPSRPFWSPSAEEKNL